MNSRAESIPVIISARLEKPANNRKANKMNNITIKRNNKLLTAVQLPVVVNVNPRSLYGKSEDFCTMMEQLEVGICCISESWDRQENGIEEIIRLENYRVIKNVVQRDGRGGKPVLVISEKDYFITPLCPDIITVPPKVEAV